MSVLSPMIRMPFLMDLLAPPLGSVWEIVIAAPKLFSRAPVSGCVADQASLRRCVPLTISVFAAMTVPPWAAALNL